MRSLVPITGSSGPIGAAAARRLAAHFDVVGLDSKAPNTHRIQRPFERRLIHDEEWETRYIPEWLEKQNTEERTPAPERTGR